MQSKGLNVVSIGTGPFLEHGIGWEAGYKAAYFGRKRLIAANEEWPSKDQLTPLFEDLQKAHPSAIMVWRGNDESREVLLTYLQPLYSEKSRVIDPILGDVGVVLFSKIADSN
jgi:hypothetical protein